MFYWQKFTQIPAVVYWPSGILRQIPVGWRTVQKVFSCCLAQFRPITISG